MAANITPNNGFSAPLSALFTGTGDFTIATWVYLPTLPASGYVALLSKDAYVSGTPPYASINLYYFSTGQIALYVLANMGSGAESMYVRSAPGIPFAAATWHHVMATVSRSSNWQYLYVDGSIVVNLDENQNQLAGVSFANTEPVRFGWNKDNNQDMTGYLADCRWYNRAFADGGVAKTLYSARGVDGIVDSLILRVPFAQNAAKDLTGNSTVSAQGTAAYVSDLLAIRG